MKRGGRGSQKKQYVGVNFLRRGLGQFADLRKGGLGKKRAMHFM